MANQATPDSDLLIAHIGDTHLRDTQYATSRRGLDFFEGFAHAVQIACRYADIVVITGDIFDRPRPSPKVIGQLMQIDQILQRAGKVALAITGNHDWSDPTWLQTLFPGRSPREGGTGPCFLANDASGIIPIDDAELTFRGYKFAGLVPHSAGTFRASLADITVRVREADVVLFHGLVDGIVKFPIHFADPLCVSEFPISRNNKAWLLGDVHLQGFVSLDRPGGGQCLVGYPGSTEMCSAAEPVEKSVPIIRLTKDGASLERTESFPIRPFIKAEVRDEEQLEALMKRIEPVAAQHPVVVVQFKRDLPHTINRLHSMLDAQRAVIRCYPLPETKTYTEREVSDEDDQHLGMEHFVSRRFDGREDLQKFALDLLVRGESDANNLIATLIETRLAATGIREDEE